MSEREPASVLLPTVEWTAACDQVADQLREGDELLIIHDTEEDPVADHAVPEGVEVVAAGEPDGCSGKANAVAAGLERASNDRIVCTDADFDRGPEWLGRIVTAGATRGPATAVPVWYGGGLWALLEPWIATFVSLLFYLNLGSTGSLAWGGGLTFTRSELDVEVPALAAELRTVLADDILIAQHLDRIHPIRSMVTPIEVSGSPRRTYARSVRFVRQTHVHEGMYAELVVSAGAVAAAVSFPIVTAVAVTVVTGVTYRILGVRRRTFVLAYLGLFLVPPAILAGIFVTEFEWAGRRYRLNAHGDVEVVGRVPTRSPDRPVGSG